MSKENFGRVVPLPQDTWNTLTEWSLALGIQERTIQKWLRDYQIPHKRVGTVWLVYAPDFYKHAPNGLSYAEETEAES